jgi:hypothetical protein
MAETFKNLANTLLDGGIDDTVTTITVDSAMGFTAGDFRILIDSEIMKVTAVSGLDLTVSRHQEGTTAVSHANDAPVYHILTAGALDAHAQNDLSVHDAYANKPAAGVSGRLFLPTDGAFIEHDNGATWDKIGPIWPMTPPVAADFPTWVNQSTSTCIDNVGTVYLTAKYATSLALRGVMKTYPGTPFTVETAFLPGFCDGGVQTRMAMGLAIRDSASGKIQWYGIGGQTNFISAIGGENYSDYSTYNSAITGWTGTYGLNNQFDSSIVWIKYQDDTSHRIISISADGVSWMQMVSLAINDYFAPNQIGFLIDGLVGNNPYYTDPSLTILHWNQY